MTAPSTHGDAVRCLRLTLPVTRCCLQSFKVTKTEFDVRGAENKEDTNDGLISVTQLGNLGDDDQAVSIDINLCRSRDFKNDKVEGIGGRIPALLTINLALTKCVQRSRSAQLTHKGGEAGTDGWEPPQKVFP